MAAQIGEIEGFDVRFVDGDEDVSRRRVDDYPFKRAAHGNWTVAKWREARFWATYPDFDVEVLKPDGSVAHGKTVLDTVRAAWAATEEPEPKGRLVARAERAAKAAARDVGDYRHDDLPNGDRWI